MKLVLTFIVLLFSIELYSQPGWFPMTSGTNLNLFCITFTSDNTGYVSGASELILKTTDATGEIYILTGAISATD